MKTIIQRLQPHTVSIYHLTDDVVEEQVVDARSLLNPTRFDLFAKLYYIRNRKENPTEAERIYKEHIRAFKKHTEYTFFSHSASVIENVGK